MGSIWMFVVTGNRSVLFVNCYSVYSYWLVMLVQIQGLNGSFLVGFALNQLSEVNEAFSVTTVIDGFILVVVL